MTINIILIKKILHASSNVLVMSNYIAGVMVTLINLTRIKNSTSSNIYSFLKVTLILQSKVSPSSKVICYEAWRRFCLASSTGKLEMFNETNNFVTSPGKER